jgi:enterochelin esterase-like enzyme
LPQAAVDASSPDASSPGASSPDASTDPGNVGDGDYTIGPMFMNAPELAARPGVPMGKMTMFTMDSRASKIFPGLNGPFMRSVYIYVPSQYVGGTPAPFVVIQDGTRWVPRVPATLLDNLIADHRIPALVAIYIDNGGGDSKGSERGLEYDTVSDRYVNFVETEVLPKVQMMANVTLTSDPNGRAALGGSSGGAAAFSMGWFRPDLYHRILTYSGTYVNQESPTDPMYPHGGWEYPEHLVAMTDPPKPLRVWLEAGSNDNGAGSSAAGMHNWALANQMMAMALAAKHYHYRFEFAQGAVHDDPRVIAQTIPEALTWLWRGY